MKNERRVAVGVWPLVGAARISLRAHPGNPTPRREPWKARDLTHLNRLRWGLRSVPGEQSLPPMTTFQVLHQDRMEANSKDTPRHTHTLTRCWVSFELCSPGWLVQRLKATTPDPGLSLTTVCSLSPVTPGLGVTHTSHCLFHFLWLYSLPDSVEAAAPIGSFVLVWVSACLCEDPNCNLMNP